MPPAGPIGSWRSSTSKASLRPDVQKAVRRTTLCRFTTIQTTVPSTHDRIKKPLREAEKKFLGAFGASTFPQNLKLEKDGSENFGVWRGGGPGIEQAAPLGAIFWDQKDYVTPPAHVTPVGPPYTTRGNCGIYPTSLPLLFLPWNPLELGEQCNTGSARTCSISTVSFQPVVFKMRSLCTHCAWHNPYCTLHLLCIAHSISSTQCILHAGVLCMTYTVHTTPKN